MTKSCTRCKHKIPIIDLTEKSHLKLYQFINQDLKLFAVKHLMTEHNYTHKEAKIVIDHMNKQFGTCDLCNYDELEHSNIDCPYCGTFNYNIKEPIFNQQFCSILEYSLKFNGLEDENLWSLWCDGIDPFPLNIENMTLKNLKENPQIKTTAWIGARGQERYDMTILLGKQSIKCFEQKLNLEDCIYSENPDDWMKIQPKKKKIVVKLK